MMFMDNGKHINEGDQARAFSYTSIEQQKYLEAKIRKRRYYRYSRYVMKPAYKASIYLALITNWREA